MRHLWVVLLFACGPRVADVEADERARAGEGGGGAAAGTSVEVPSDMRALEREVVAELNAFREDPRGYVAKLESLRAKYRGKEIIVDAFTRIMTNEGVAAVDDAIRFMKRGPASLPKYRVSETLAKMARAHADDLRKNDLIGHIGSDGSTPEERAQRHGVVDGIGENVAHGTTSGEDTIVGLLIDDGVPNRGHRKLMYMTDFREVGVGCATHPTWRTSCVINFSP